jgi:hypothetical protein
MVCMRCQTSGFLNLEQVDTETLARYNETGDQAIILQWIKDHVSDVSVCGCCDDGTDWYGLPGLHDLNSDEPFPECY